MSFSKEELISKLETISSLWKQALSIKMSMNNFVPEDNYERKIIVPNFPDEFESEKERNYLFNNCKHVSSNAVDQMRTLHESIYAPKKPEKQKLKEFKKPDDEDYKNNKVKIGCFSYIAIAISIFFIIGSFVGVDKSSSDALPTIYTISAIAAVVFVILRVILLILKKAQIEKEQKAFAEYSRKEEEITKEYNKQMQIYEENLAKYMQAQESFISEYSNWRKIYIDHLNEEEAIKEKLAADRLAHVEKINEEELNPVLTELMEVNDVLSDNYLSSVDTIIDLIKSGRADDLKEALNLYEDLQYRERQLQLQREQEAHRQHEEDLRRQDEERRYREDIRFREDQERQRQREEMQRQQDAERRHREEMAQRDQQERIHQYEEQKRREAEQRKTEKAELARKQNEDRATFRQCNTCALVSQCSMSFKRPNCASYKPR